MHPPSAVPAVTSHLPTLAPEATQGNQGQGRARAKKYAPTPELRFIQDFVGGLSIRRYRISMLQCGPPGGAVSFMLMMGRSASPFAMDIIYPPAPTGSNKHNSRARAWAR